MTKIIEKDCSIKDFCVMQVLIASVDYVPARVNPEWEQLLSKTVKELSRLYHVFIPYETRVTEDKVEFRLLNVPLLEWYKDTPVRTAIVDKIVHSLNLLLGGVIS